MMRADAPAVTGLDPENPYALTVLEQQVVDLLIGGLTGEEVGDLLGIDRRSVALKRASAMRKYGARNGLHLAHLVEITRRSPAVAASEVVALEDIPSSLAV
jgi:DNA-binding CsgD family transcriptional regulator